MNKFNRFIFRFKNQLFFSLVAIFAALGVYVGYVTVDRYKTIVNATLGFTILLLYPKFLSPRKTVNQPDGIQLEFPKDLKYLIYAFIKAIIMFWAGIQVLHLVWYLIDIFTD